MFWLLCLALFLSPAASARAASAANAPKVLHYSLVLRLHVTGSGDQGGDMDITWAGLAGLTLTMDRATGCYTPRFDDDRLDVNVAGFTMVGAGGTPAELTSPRSYNIKMGAPTLNYCARQPELVVPFNTQGFPIEKITADGQSRQVALFGNFLMGVLVLNNINNEDSNDVTKEKDNSNFPHENHEDDAAIMRGYQAMIDAHKDDPSWLVTPAGQAAIRGVQGEAAHLGAPEAPQPNDIYGDASSRANVMGAYTSANLPWSKVGTRVRRRNAARRPGPHAPRTAHHRGPAVTSSLAPIDRGLGDSPDGCAAP